ncbi:MAG: family 16 glycosylhydrolase [Polaribacter sp.]
MIKNYFFVGLFLFFGFAGFSQQMPIDFSNENHSFATFNNTSFSKTNNPQDNNDQVGQFINDGSAAYQGSYIDLTRPIDLSANKTITLSFYAFDSNSHNIILKLESGSNADVEVIESFSVPSPSNWKTISFDFSNAKLSGSATSINATGTYSRLTIFIDGGTTISGTYLIDNITDGSTPLDPNVLDVTYNDLVWSDEFDSNGDVDGSKWYHQTFGPNGGGWFNGELQHYTNSSTNSFVDGGNLNIVAKRETKILNGVSRDFTSARLNSKYAFTYGRVDVRAKLPSGNGTWPAIWTLGKNISETGAYWQTQGFGTTGWPACGEIDIMEHGLHANNEVSSALHTPSSNGNTVNVGKKTLVDVANNFHIYSMNWSPNQITFLVDNVVFYTYNPSEKNDDTWPFDKEQFLLLNVAIGGFSGTPAANFSQSSMVIDYVRVYQNKNLSTGAIFKDAFSVYPNPTSNKIYIQTNKQVDRVELYSTLGKMVFSKNNVNEVNTKSLNSGLYLMRIYSDKNIVTKKVLIKN